jgi:CheY-like chemotaxis protein
MPAETILIVDDDPICCTLAGIILRHAGFNTHTASDGLEALDLLQTIQPDLILSDIQMPNMDGLELARRTRQNPRLCEIPMVALTAANGTDMAERAYEAGFSAHLSKPIQGAALTAQVRRYLVRATNSSTIA